MDEIRAEIASIKSALAQAAEKVDALDGLVARPESLVKSETAETPQQYSNTQLIARAEQLLAWSRFKAKTLSLGSGLFADSCWNMCLDIYICDLKEEQITVSSIAHSSGIPMTTAMRYINVMAEELLLEKTPNPSDHRMIFVSTSAACKEKISAILANFSA